MEIRKVAENDTYAIERHSCYAHRVNEQVEWIVIGKDSNMIVASYATRKEALEWLKDLRIKTS